jgi:hypothetical protein
LDPSGADIRFSRWTASVPTQLNVKPFSPTRAGAALLDSPRVTLFAKFLPSVEWMTLRRLAAFVPTHASARPGVTTSGPAVPAAAGPRELRSASRC